MTFEMKLVQRYDMGFEDGFRQGNNQGVEQGKVWEMYSIIRTMLAKNYKKETIIEITGCTENDIETVLAEI